MTAEGFKNQPGPDRVASAPAADVPSTDGSDHPVRDSQSLDEAAATVKEALENPDRTMREAHVLARQGKAHPSVAALDVLVAAAARADRLAEALRQLGWMPNSDSPFWCFCREPSEPGDHHTDACTLAGGLMATTGEVGTDADPPSVDALTDSLGRSHVDLADDGAAG